MEGQPIVTERFQVGTGVWQRFYAGLLFRRAAVAGAVWLAVTIGLGFVDLRLSACMVILALAILPMAWILGLARLMGVAENRRNTLAMAVRLTPGRSVEITRWLPDDDEPDGERAVTERIADPELRVAGRSAGHMVVRGRRLILLIPPGVIIRS